MNIKEALEWSKANNGSAVTRGGSWIAWLNPPDPSFKYRLTFEDLTADDWEPLIPIGESK